MRINRKATAAVCFAFAIALGACGSSDKTSDAPDEATTTTTPAATELTVSAGDYKFEGLPETIPAGLVNLTFDNKGQTDHELVFLKVEDNSDPEAVLEGLGKVLQGEKFPADLLAANGIGGTPAGEKKTAQINLTPGEYVVGCALTSQVGSDEEGQPHFARGMFGTVTVTGEGGETTPTADAELVAKDYSFDVDTIKAGEQEVAFVNDGPTEWHFAAIMQYPEGTTAEAAEADLPKILESQGPPPEGVVAPEPFVDSGVASPGYGNTFNATFESGRTYVALCFVSDKTGGPPHAIAHKMFKVFTVE
jgi:hypothetical protein